MKRLLYILLIGCCHLTAQASDTIRIVGTITDEQGEPIIGAYIKAHDSIGNDLSRGTVSDYDGKFYLVTQRSQNVKYLVVSYICCFPDTIYLTDEPLQKYDITLKFRYDNCWDDVIVTDFSPSLLSDTFFYQLSFINGTNNQRSLQDFIVCIVMLPLIVYSNKFSCIIQIEQLIHILFCPNMYR